MSRAPIGVFDSGVGGLSVLRHIHRMLPEESLVYVADSAYAPYGGRSSEEIRERAHAICQFLIEQGVRAIVVACNTATAVAVTSLRASLTVPIIAMEPAIKPAAAMTRSGVVGVLATERTLASDQIARLVERHAQGCRVLLQSCPGFVDQVERGELTGARTQAVVAASLQPLLDAGIDVLVLGCTHYPFLLPVIRDLVGETLTIIDPAVAVTQELQRRLQTVAAPVVASGTVPTLQFYTTGLVARVQPVMEALWGTPVGLT
ncbi:MAG: glutamate racemase, partial [Abyssibacter sp.]|uniref:glutamate racemase n=1 Tax=Abyssibacter sp. TaxID=2320200 RepID=UPI00321ADFD6